LAVTRVSREKLDRTSIVNCSTDFHGEIATIPRQDSHISTALEASARRDGYIPTTSAITCDKTQWD
jgi:hypothetical protein